MIWVLCTDTNKRSLKALHNTLWDAMQSPTVEYLSDWVNDWTKLAKGIYAHRNVSVFYSPDRILSVLYKYVGTVLINNIPIYKSQTNLIHTRIYILD